MLSRHSEGTCQGNELTLNSSRNARSQSSQLAELLWTGFKKKKREGGGGGTRVRELLSTFKEKAQTGTDSSKKASFKILVCEEKTTTTTISYKMKSSPRQRAS